MKKTLLALLTLILLLSCNETGNEGPAVDPSNKNANTGYAGKYATRIEIPAIESGDLFLSHTTTRNGKENVTYSIAHNPARKHCRWTAFTFDPSNRAISWKRDNWENTEWGGDPFQPCPDMPENYVMTKSEINRNGFVRGHVVASYDRVYSKDANEQTFYGTNIAPQLNEHNEGIWTNIENKVRSVAKDSDTTYVVTGCIVADSQEFSTDSDGKQITVPTAFFKAVLRYKASDSAPWTAAGFFTEHKKYSSNDLKPISMTIDELEEKTGLDFFVNLAGKIGKDEAAAIEAADPSDSSVWGL